MGHVSDTYNQVESLGVEKLRSIYASANLCIKPKTRLSKIETLKEMIRAMGENPEQILAKDALEAHATQLDNHDFQNRQHQALSAELRRILQEQFQRITTQTG